MLNSLRSAPLITSRSFGPITLRDVAVAAGQADAPEGGRKIDQAGLDAAFREAGPEAVSSILKVASGAAVHLRALDAVVGTHTGGATAGLSKLAQLLGEATRAAKAHAALDDDGGSDTQATGSGDGAPAARAGLPGTITSRDDVVAALDRICAYYEQNEPANPIPLMLARCKRLVTMSFLDIVRDMAPDAVTQIELIAGKRES
jgi:type VI secretion system protein ImpA